MKPSTNTRADYNQYVAKGMQLIHSPETRDAIVGILKLKGKAPVQLVADTVVVVIRKADNATREAGIEIQDVVKLLAAHEFVTQICEIAEAARLFTLKPDVKELALSVAVQDYVRGEISAGRIDPVRLMAQVEKGMRQISPKQRSEVLQSIDKIKKTAINYQG